MTSRQTTLIEWAAAHTHLSGGKWQCMPAGSSREDWQNCEPPYAKPNTLWAYRYLSNMGNEIARFTTFAGGFHLLTPASQKGQPGWSPKADDVQVGGTHYKDMAIQPWDVMETLLTREEFIGFLKGNYLKYAMRAGHKGDAAEDAKKALHYKQKLQEVQGHA